MLGEACGLIAVAKGFETLQMVLVERTSTTNREANAVDGKRVSRPQTLQHRVRQAACAHIIFGMNFDKGQRAGCLGDAVKMLGLEADTDGRGQMGVDHDERLPMALAKGGAQVVPRAQGCGGGSAN